MLSAEIFEVLRAKYTLFPVYWWISPAGKFGWSTRCWEITDGFIRISMPPWWMRWGILLRKQTSSLLIWRSFFTCWTSLSGAEYGWGIEASISRLSDCGPEVVVITGVPVSGDKTNSYMLTTGTVTVTGRWCPYLYAYGPGTGDAFASVVTGALLQGESLPIAFDRANTVHHAGHPRYLRLWAAR